MPQLKLTYFDVDGGRGEAIRLAMHIGNIAFDDHRFSFADFEAERAKTPLSQVPVLTLDGEQITQSNAILRYIGKLADLYPADNKQALICDEVLDAVEDCTDKIVATFFLKGVELEKAREQLVQGDLTKYLQFLERKLSAQGGEYFADQRLTIADLKVLPMLSWLMSGQLDHVPQDIVANVAPSLVTHQQKIANEQVIKAYYHSRK
ncbi:glutathione S-transferase [Thalassotalea ganghwensis]